MELSNTPIGKYSGLMILGLITIIFFEKESLAVAGFIMLFVSFLGLIYELKMKYDFKYYDSSKDFGRMSYGERRIAEWFKRRNIKFEFEKKIKIGKYSYKPDFYLPEFEIYLEYWGMWNSNNIDYKKEAREKRIAYKKDGMNFIELYPDKLNNLDWHLANRLFNALKQR